MNYIKLKIDLSEREGMLHTEEEPEGDEYNIAHADYVCKTYTHCTPE